jgi:hypothetical protein
MFLRPVGFETTIRGAFPGEYQQTNARLAGVDVQTHWKMSEQWQHDSPSLCEWTRHYKQGIFDRYSAIESEQ